MRSRWILAAVSTALFCVQIDYFAMNLALPRMAADLDSNATDLQWVISVYMLALGAFMVPAGRIGDIFGRRRALLAGIAIFGLASALCAIASSAALVIVFRAVQGLGAALIFPVSVSVLTNAFPAVRAGQAIGLAYGIAGLGNAAGPLVGGLLTQTLGWRWIFWLLVPFSLVAFVIGALTVPESSDDTVPRRIDVTGLALITIGIGLFTLTFDRAPNWGWLSPGTIIAFICAIAVLAAFILVERRVRWPLLDLSLFRNARFTVLVVAGTIANIAYAVTHLSLHAEPAAGARPGPADGRSRVPGPVHRCGAGRPAVGSVGGEVSAGARHGGRLRGRGVIACGAGGVARLGRLRNRAHRMRIHHGTGVRVHHRRDAGRRAARTGGRGGRGGA